MDSNNNNMTGFKIGDLVMVVRGEHKGLKGHIYDISNDKLFIVGIRKDTDEEFITRIGDCDSLDAMKIYTDEELRYAADLRCQCGAGMAYVKEPMNMWGSWVCSDILAGRASLDRTVTHSSPKHFAYYEIKSEDQPSAYGATTRPKKDG